MREPEAAKPQNHFRHPSRSELDPEILHQLHFSFVPSRVLSVGVRMGVFSHVAAGRQTVPAIARAAGGSERGMRMLLDALVALGLLTKAGQRYGLTPLAARYLVRKSPDYLGSFLETDGLWESWGKLEQVIRTGQPVFRVEQQDRAEQFFPVLVRTLHVLQRDRAVTAARALGSLQRRKGLRVVDVACGSGVWSIPYAEANRTARVTAQDFPAMLKVTRQYLKRHGVLNQYDFLPGDLKSVDFGISGYDVAILGNIVHSEGERSSRNLFGRLHRALVPGGRLVIVDMVPNDDRTGPPFPVFFALNMLVNTEQGDTFTLAEYRRWLKEAGFSSVTDKDIGAHSPLIIATKP
ncbi:MAG TPA: class I SAM-dependent methyltransferase [Terriglobia bacterium]|nr:class I SAM-dependent methyltransferase [Terriglobia bacterium]